MGEPDVLHPQAPGTVMHLATARWLLWQAKTALDHDHVQAAEKASGSAAHMVKDLSLRRGW